MEEVKYIKGVEDLSGKRFGKLVVIKRVGTSSWGKYATWECHCDCGGTKITASQTLKRGKVKSCGCINKIRIELREPEALFNCVYASLKDNAKRRKIFFNLSKEVVKKLSKEVCYYCGSEPSNIKAPKNSCYSIEPYKYNGIDRIDSSKGYEENNVVSCCSFCNFAKGAASYVDFKKWIERAYKWQQNQK